MTPTRTCVALAALALSGCAGGGVPMQKTYPVSGAVLLDGKPVPNATVVFHPVDAGPFKWNERPQGKTDAQGRFTLTTYATGDGAPAAAYKVAVATLDAAGDDGGDQVKHVRGAVRVPRKYWSHDTSGLTATVGAAATDLEPLALKSKP
jgi:hypothetical protein